jgi:1-acyl-sn-glycerol-3-phosphate acyltransferase
MKLEVQKMENKTRNFNRRYANEYNIFRTIFYMTFLCVVVYGFYLIFYNFKIVGRENLPAKVAKRGKYIYAANHVSIFDPPMVAMAAMCPIAFMAKKELFDPSEKLSWLVKRLGAFAVDRSKPEIATFKTVKDIVSTSWSLGIFPQGGTRPYGKLEGIRKGFVSIAKSAKADIVPIAIADFDGYPKLKPFTRRNVTIKVGKPISYQLNDDEIIYEWSRQISELANYENCAPLPASIQKQEEPQTV